MIDDRSANELINGGDTRLHYHLEDRATNAGLQQAATRKTITGDTTLTYKDDFALVDTSSASITISLPLARDGREIEVVKLSPVNSVFVVPTAPNTVLGATGVIISGQYDAIRFKSVDGGWIAI